MGQRLIRPMLAMLMLMALVGMAYGAARHASGEGGTADSAPTPADLPPDLTPRPGYTPIAVQTPQFQPTWPSADQMGDFAPGGAVYTKLGAPISLPSGVGDFRVWGGLRDPGGPFVAVYHIKTRSVVFLEPKEDEHGTVFIETNRDIKQPEANDVLDQVVLSVGEAAR